MLNEVVGSARAHREERRARAGLEALVDTCPVGVVVFDAATGVPLSLNREAARILAGLNAEETPLERLRRVWRAGVAYRRGDGRHVRALLKLDWRPSTSLRYAQGERLS